MTTQLLAASKNLMTRPADEHFASFADMTAAAAWGKKTPPAETTLRRFLRKGAQSAGVKQVVVRIIRTEQKPEPLA